MWCPSRPGGDPPDTSGGCRDWNGLDDIFGISGFFRIIEGYLEDLRIRIKFWTFGIEWRGPKIDGWGWGWMGGWE